MIYGIEMASGGMICVQSFMKLKVLPQQFERL
jgi:hypothetical protein